MDNFVLILTGVEISSDSANGFLFWGEKHIPSRAMFVVPSAGWNRNISLLIPLLRWFHGLMSLVYTNKPDKRRPFFLFKTGPYCAISKARRRRNYDKKTSPAQVTSFHSPLRHLLLLSIYGQAHFCAITRVLRSTRQQRRGWSNKMASPVVGKEVVHLSPFELFLLQYNPLFMCCRPFVC